MPAAGRGERAGSGDIKQFRPIAGVPMLLRAIRPFAAHPRVRRIVVALPPDVARRPPAWLADVAGGALILAPGGAARPDSVAAAAAPPGVAGDRVPVARGRRAVRPAGSSVFLSR